MVLILPTPRQCTWPHPLIPILCVLQLTSCSTARVHMSALQGVTGVNWHCGVPSTQWNTGRYAKQGMYLITVSTIPLPISDSVHCMVSHIYVDGFHSIFSLGNWRALHHLAACRLVNIYITWHFLPSSFYGERCYGICLYRMGGWY